MNDFPVYPQNPVKKAAKKPNAFFRFFGHPLWTVLTLTALFLWCLFFSPGVQAIWVVYFFLFSPILICFILSLIGLFGMNRIAAGVISTLLFIFIILNFFNILNLYNHLDFKIKEPKMREISEQMFIDYSHRLGYAENEISLSLPSKFQHLSCDGLVCLKHVKKNGEVILTATFARYFGVPDGDCYYVYQNKKNPNWEADFVEDSEYSITYLNDQFYVLFEY